VAALVGFHQHAAHDVAGHQVRRELDSRIFQMQSARQGTQQSGFAKARNTLQQHMAAR